MSLSLLTAIAKDGIWIPKDKPELAREILRGQRDLGRRATLDPEGLMLEEELPEHLKGKGPNKGGRPSKSSRRVDD